MVLLLSGCNALLGIHTFTPPDDGAVSRDSPLAACTAPGCACTASAQCASLVCIDAGGDGEDSGAGACADPGSVAYVASMAGGTTPGAPCTQAAPCGTMGQALATRQPLISVTGTIVETIAITNAVDIYGDSGGATLSSGGGSAVVTVSGAVAVGLHDLTVTSANNTAAGVSTNGSAALDVRHCKITGNTGVGILTGAGGSLGVQRSTISDNGGGGIDADDATVTLVNDFVVNNGTPSGLVGGVRFEADVDSVVFDYDTVCRNESATSNAGHSGGVTCSSVNTQLSNSIVAGNVGFSSNPDVLGCQLMATYAGSDLAQFDFASAVDFHIGSDSAALGMAVLDDVRIDIDGDVRPQHIDPDQGADERVDGATP